MKYGLEPQDLQSIIRLLQTYPQIQSALLFGSRAKGTYTDGSDIDISLDAQDLTFQQFLELKHQCDDLWLPYKIDLVLFHNIQEPALIEHIERIGQELLPVS